MFHDISLERKNMKSFKQKVKMKTTHTAFLFVKCLENAYSAKPSFSLINRNRSVLNVNEK